MKYFILQKDLRPLEKDGKVILFDSLPDARVEVSKIKDATIYPDCDILGILQDLKRSCNEDYCDTSYSYYERLFKNLLNELT